MTIDRYGQAAACLVIVVLVAAACENRSLASRFHSCVLGGVETIKHGGGEQTRMECALPAEAVLIARRRGQVNSDELLRAGLSKNLADTLAGSRESAQWCAAEEYEPKPIPRHVDHAEVLLTKSECVDTEVEIPRIMQARSSRIAVTLGVSSSGAVTLIDFEAR
jgi:hypothetical protein